MIIYFNEQDKYYNPPIFKNRVRGESSGNIKLIFQSLMGLLKLFLIKSGVVTSL